MAFARLLASSKRFRASAILPSISANSPRLCVATAQPISHSSVLSGGAIFADTAIAFSAHALALPTRADFDIGDWPGVDGGFCWAREMERLFTAQGLAFLTKQIESVAYLIQRYGSLWEVTELKLGEIKGQRGSADSSPHNGGQVLDGRLVKSIVISCFQRSILTFQRTTNLLWGHPIPLIRLYSLLLPSLLFLQHRLNSPNQSLFRIRLLRNILIRIQLP